MGSKKNKPATTNTTNPPALKIGTRIRCTDDGVEGRVVRANGLMVTIAWTDGEKVTWRRDSLASKPIEILDADDEQATAPASAVEAPAAATESDQPAPAAEETTAASEMDQRAPAAAETTATAEQPPTESEATPAPAESITEVVSAVKALDQDVYGVLVIDSITILWDACKNAFTGKLTKAGTVPLHGWTAIKRPYKELLHLLLASPVHVLICGRQGNDFAEDEASGELKNVGYKMRAEGETAYEPDVLIRMESHKANRKDVAIPTAHVEKDRSGILAGQSIQWPAFDNVAKPLLGLLGATHAAPPTDDEVSQLDTDALHRQEIETQDRSAELAAEYTARFSQADAVVTLERLGKELTPEVKTRMTQKDLDRVRRAYATRLGQLKGEERGASERNGRADGAANGTTTA